MSPSAYLRSWRPRSRNAVPLALVAAGLVGAVVVIRDGRHVDAACRCVHYEVGLLPLGFFAAVALLGAFWYRTADTGAFVQGVVTIGGLIPSLRLGRRATDAVVPATPVPVPVPPLDVPPVDGFDDSPLPFADEPSPAAPRVPADGAEPEDAR